MASLNLITARRYVRDLVSCGTLAMVDALVAPTCALRDPLFGDGHGPGAVREHIAELRRAFPELALTIDEVLVETHTQLALCWTARGVHCGPLLGIPPSQRRMTVSGLLLCRFVDAKLLAVTWCWSPYDMLRQLELIPVAEPAELGARRKTVELQPRSEVDRAWAI